MRSSVTKILSLLFVLIFTFTVEAQERLIQDYSKVMEIPEIVAMESSPTHLYVLSEAEGMVVFRAYSDSLQWLYTSSGMQRRGSNIMADIRFAYLFGETNRLTVLEPTSALGVYSSTLLPQKPMAAARIGNALYIALGQNGLGKVSLETPETVDSEPELVASEQISGDNVIDVRSTPVSKQLFVLTNAPSLLVFDVEEQNLALSQNIMLNTNLTNIFVDNENVWGANSKGEVFGIRSAGIGQKLGMVNEPVDDIYKWENRLFVRTESGEIWVSETGSNSLKAWKTDGAAKNLLAKNKERLWIAENDKISEIKIAVISDSSLTANASQNSGFKIKTIPNQIVTYPTPLLLALEMEGNHAAQEVEFSYRSNIKNALIRKQGLFWQPNVNQVGGHWFTIVATDSEGRSDSTRFLVDVRSFNSPPRFSPVRNTSIAVNEKYELSFSAVDPENPKNSIVRYIGVDMPDGANLNEKTGTFVWTPSDRQIGESTFKVIATDKLGAASSIEVTLKVLDITRESPQNRN
ncbi:Ig domain-containing protein [Gracilimonas sp. Q87]|uniref:Ig domain-containing protein n=1 Tax=Gracilimonas sp. Q87 TaxID=3384766 RepID=UPI0039842360